MFTDFFEISKPKFISMRNQQFYIDGKSYGALHVNIQDLLPVKKRFVNGKLTCYAINTKISSTGKDCSLCPERFDCFMKVRIMMQLNRISTEHIPAALEVGKNDFKTLQLIINNISKNELNEKNIKITFSNKKLEFSLGN